MDKDLQIIGATFGIINGYGVLDEEQFIGLAQTYLGFCSTMPYDAADAETTRAWVEATIAAKASSSLTVGDALFELNVTTPNDLAANYWMGISVVAE